MPDDNTRPEETERLRSEAAEWFARMRREDSGRFAEEFETWLADPAHRGAYNRIAARFAEAKLLRHSPVADARLKPVRARQRWALPVLVLALAAAGIGALIAWPPLTGSGPAGMVPPTGTATLTSAPARISRFRLVDGSVVTLDSDSRIAIKLDRGVRHIQLMQGRARFAVAHDPRPFTVVADGAKVTAHGTLFDVLLRDGQIAVALIEGIVAVDAPVRSESSAPIVQHRMRPGEALNIAPSGARRLAAFDAANPPDWPRAVVEVRDVTLGDLLDRANRLNAVRLAAASPAIAAIRVSGRFRLDDPVHLARTIARLLDLEADSGTPGVITLRLPTEISASP